MFFFLLFVCFTARSQRSRSDGRWTTDWSLWLWPTMETLTCRSLLPDWLPVQTSLGHRVAMETSSCQGQCWASVSKRTDKGFSQTKHLCSLAALMFPSYCFFIAFISLNIYKSLCKVSVFLWKFAFVLVFHLPAGSTNCSKERVNPEETFAVKAQTLHPSFRLIFIYLILEHCMGLSISCWSLSEHSDVFLSLRQLVRMENKKRARKEKRAWKVLTLPSRLPASPFSVFQAYFCTILVQHDTYLCLALPYETASRYKMMYSLVLEMYKLYLFC